MGQSARVRLKDGLSDPPVIGRGTRQGCSLSLILFNIYSEAMLRNALSGANECFQLGGHLIKTMSFADGHAALASSVKALQLMMDKMQDTAGEYDLNIKIN